MPSALKLRGTPVVFVAYRKRRRDGTACDRFFFQFFLRVFSVPRYDLSDRRHPSDPGVERLLNRFAFLFHGTPVPPPMGTIPIYIHTAAPLVLRRLCMHARPCHLPDRCHLSTSYGGRNCEIFYVGIL